MTWNLQSYPTTVLNERMWHFWESNHALTPLTYFQDGQDPQLTMIYATDALYIKRFSKPQQFAGQHLSRSNDNGTGRSQKCTGLPRPGATYGRGGTWGHCRKIIPGHHLVCRPVYSQREAKWAMSPKWKFCPCPDLVNITCTTCAKCLTPSTVQQCI